MATPTLSREDSPLPTETTALLSHSRSLQDTPPITRPSVSPVVNHLRAHGPHAFASATPLGYATLADSEQAAFRLIIYLQLYLLSKRPTLNGQDVWEQWSAERVAETGASDFERLLLHTWSEFVERNRSGEEIETCLWTSFPLDDGAPRQIRVVDMLNDPDGPTSFLSHRLVFISLLRTWNHGRALRPAPSALKRVIQILESKATPRVLHALDIFIHLGYLAMLANYLLHPPNSVIINSTSPQGGPREVLLIIYSVASLCRLWTAYVVPCSLVALTFLFSLPATPLPGEITYGILLGSFVLHILLLHLPRTPSPNFLFAPEVTLPLSTLLWHEFTWTLYPALLFYFPAFLLSSYLLSVALMDSIPVFTVGTVFTLIRAAPMATREAFVALWATVILLILTSTTLLVLFSASVLSSSTYTSGPWDRYSQPVGQHARRIFVTAVLAYSSEHFFPPPFNLLQLVFIHPPVVILRLFGKRDLRFILRVESVLWRGTVGLCALVVAGIWLWISSLPLSPSLGR
ncbi:hypothetical protein OF83DRAFT_1050784 [Amylostereum chailletii]|nr:hypothetical protein OF83DRAFT_1050784 [Amylostereum chailletii]